MILTGKNTDFIAIFDCTKQVYTVYKFGKIIVTNKYKFSEIQSYLN